MALKNLFEMAKADRYTADGREAIIKAQEEETEDKVYQIGEISQKTGLQKTANGWVKPKGNKAGTKKPDNTREKLRKFREASSKKQELPSDLQKQAQEYVAWEKPENIQRYIKNLRTPFSKERDSFENPDKLAEALEVELKKKTEGNKPAAPETLAKVSHDNLDVARNEMNTTPEEDQMLDYFVTEMHEDGTGLDEIIKRQDGIYERSNGAYPKEEKTYKSLREKIMNHYGAKSESKGSNAETKPAESKPAESNRENRINEYWRKIRKETQPVARMAAELDRGTFDDDVINTMGDGQSMEDLARSLISPAFEDDGYIPQNKLDTARKFILKRYKALESDATDAAPRVLTGDTRIRVRKA